MQVVVFQQASSVADALTSLLKQHITDHTQNSILFSSTQRRPPGPPSAATREGLRTLRVRRPCTDELSQPENGELSNTCHDAWFPFRNGTSQDIPSHPQYNPALPFNYCLLTAHALLRDSCLPMRAGFAGIEVMTPCWGLWLVIKQTTPASEQRPQPRPCHR